MMACSKCKDVRETAIQPFTDQCVKYFWNSLRDPPSGYRTALDESVLYRVFYCLPEKSGHARLVFSDDGVHGFTIELFIDEVPEPQTDDQTDCENTTELRVCLASTWRKKHALWIPIPKIGINTSRQNLYLYAIDFMKEFGTHYNRKNHSCQDFILWFLRSLGIPKPFRTAMGKLKLAGKIALAPVVALYGAVVGIGVTIASPIAIPVALWKLKGDPDRSYTALVLSPVGAVMFPVMFPYFLLVGETDEELVANREKAKEVGINVTKL